MTEWPEKRYYLEQTTEQGGQLQHCKTSEEHATSQEENCRGDLGSRWPLLWVTYTA